ncbi:7397_t:CDS:1, partial [Funneliformis geosporum]
VIPVQREKRHPKHMISGKEIMISPMGPDTIFEANAIVKIPSNVPPSGKTKFMLIKNKLQIKVTFERSRHSVMIMREIVIGRNFLDDKSAADMRESMDYFSS